MNTIFDIPAHPLMVHFPVVAIPVLSLVCLVMALRPRFRELYARPILVLGIVTVVATFLAASSGDALVESLDLTDEFIDPHRDLGNLLRFLVLGQTLAIGAVIAVNKRSTATGRDSAAIASAVVLVGFSLLSLVWVVRTGHEGAKAVWGSGETSSQTDEANAAIADAGPTTTSATPPTTEPPSETSPDSSTTSEQQSTTTEAVAETEESVLAGMSGQEVFEANCARCHGADGGGGRGPSLQGLAIEQPDPTDATTQVVNGGNGMPAFGARLDAAQIDAAIEYIYETF